MNKSILLINDGVIRFFIFIFLYYFCVLRHYISLIRTWDFIDLWLLFAKSLSIASISIIFETFYKLFLVWFYPTLESISLISLLVLFSISIFLDEWLYLCNCFDSFSLVTFNSSNIEFIIFLLFNDLSILLFI